MKILQICNKPPFPPVEGGPMAMAAITNGLLNAQHNVSLLVVDSEKMKSDFSKISNEVLEKTNFKSVFINLKINPFDALKCFFTGKSLHAIRYMKKGFLDAITAKLDDESFDVIFFDSIFSAVFIDEIRELTKAKIVIRAHNVEHKIWERIAQNTKNPFKKFYLNHIYKSLKNFEMEICSKADAVFPISDVDTAWFQNKLPQKIVKTLPFGVDISKKVEISKHNKTLFFIGSLNWSPNIEGLLWFLKEVWNNKKLNFPELKLVVAGRHMPDELFEFADNRTEFVGEVPDSTDFMLQNGAMIVPLLSGSGIRIKIIEALMNSKVVISTKIGAEGINYTHGKDIIIADTPEEFCEAINNYYNSAENSLSISENARQLIENEHNNKIVIDDLIKTLNKLIDE